MKAYKSSCLLISDIIIIAALYTIFILGTDTIAWTSGHSDIRRSILNAGQTLWSWAIFVEWWPRCTPYCSTVNLTGGNCVKERKPGTNWVIRCKLNKFTHQDNSIHQVFSLSALTISVCCRKSTPRVQGSNQEWKKLPKGKINHVSPKCAFPSHIYEILTPT